MQVYDKLIKTTEELLSAFSGRNLTQKPVKPWKMLKENEFLLRNEVAFELGEQGFQGTCYQAVTSSEELVGEDKILLYGPDLQEIRGNVPFTRITWLLTDSEENQDKAYREIKKLEFARFKMIPKGYMMLSSSMEQKEQVKVSKQAIREGLDFSTIGHLIIDKYKKEFGVKHVQVMFITEELPIIPQLIDQGKKADEITNAFDHILKNIILDCDLCPLHPICDDVEELRKVHFEAKKEKLNI